MYSLNDYIFVFYLIFYFGNFIINFNGLFLFFFFQVEYPPLNLALTVTPEFLKQIESLQQQQRHDSNSTPPGKTKPMSFPISKITIGEWTRDAVYEQDLKGKIYFAYKKIMWECLEDDVTTETTRRRSRKIEMQWCDVLSLKPWYHPHDQTGILSVEVLTYIHTFGQRRLLIDSLVMIMMFVSQQLRKPPTFFIETNPQALKHTQWQKLDQDFTFNHSASRSRFFFFLSTI